MLNLGESADEQKNRPGPFRMAPGIPCREFHLRRQGTTPLSSSPLHKRTRRDPSLTCQAPG